MRDIHHVHQHVGLAYLVEGRLERVDKVSWQLADEADGVGEQDGQVVDGNLAHGGVEGGEKLVLGKDVAFAEQVHYRALAHVGVSHQGHAGELAAVFALDGLLLVDGGQLLLQQRDAVEDDAAVGLDLCLTGAAHADTAALTLEVGPHARQSRQQVLVLGELDLRLGAGRLRAAGEDVEDEARAVEDFHLQLALDVRHLLRGQVVVENHQADVVVLDVGAQLLELALAHVGARVGVVELLHEHLFGDGTGGVGQKGQLGQILHGFQIGLLRCHQSD